jgi:reactive intermediate/imine deaminase
MSDRNSVAVRAFGAAIVVALLHAGAFASPAPDGELEYWSTKALPPGLPFSEAVQVGELVFLSGQIGILPGTRTLAPGGIREEARQTMENIRATLGARGYGLDRLVRCTVMLADMAEWETFNEVYRTFFTGRYPARSAFGANGLALGARVEVECLAAVPPGNPAAPPVIAVPAPPAPPADSDAPAPSTSTAPPAAPSAAAAPHGRWLLVEIGGDAPLSGTETILELAGDGAVSGRGPCNRYGGRVEKLAGDRIDLSPLQITRRACANPAVGRLEGDYFTALGKSERFAREGERLSLLGADGKVLLRFSWAPPAEQ